MTASKKSGEPPEEDTSESLPAIEDMNLEDTDIEAYTQLNKELDEINDFLDALEKKNDSLHEQLFNLLEESRNIRSEIKKESSAT